MYAPLSPVPLAEVKSDSRAEKGNQTHKQTPMLLSAFVSTPAVPRWSFPENALIQEPKNETQHKVHNLTRDANTKLARKNASTWDPVDDTHSPVNDSTCSVKVELDEIYDGFGNQLKENGFVRSEIEEGHSDFSNTTGGQMHPRMYTEPPWYMPGEGPVRPIAIRISDVHELKHKVINVREKVVHALGHAAKVSRQPDDAIHTTLYHPDTFYAWRKKEVGSANSSQSPEQMLPMTHTALAHELETIRNVLKRFPHDEIELEVARVAMTSGGVLLLLLRPTAEKACENPSQMDELRANFSKAFPNGSGPTKILHVSVLRLLDLPDDQLADKAKAVDEICEAATEELAGYRFKVSRLLFVHEMQVLTLKGNWYWSKVGPNV